MAECPTCNCKKKPCGCEDQGLTTNTPCAQDTPDCPNPDPCAETFSDQCVVHMPDGIVDIGIVAGERLNVTLQRLALILTNPGCIMPGSTCLSVLNLRSVKITSTTVKVAWNPSDTVDAGYIVEYKEASAMSWTANPMVLPSTNPTDTIGGLLPDTEYDIRVSTLCTMGSCYSVTIRVKTVTV